MPKHKRSAKAMQRRVDRKRAKKGDSGNPGVRQDYQQAKKENHMFEKYYKEQSFIPEEDQEKFMATLREPLPTTFRITGFKGQSQELLKLVKSEFFNKLLNSSTDDLEIEAPTQLPWYPDGLAWQINFGRKEIRHSEVLKDLKQFLISETESGNISRQEAVSMIPPLLLDVHPGHRVLDMCAAPGSKTAQLIEMLHKENNDPKTADEGFVLANDSDNKRCYLMCHQVKRLESAKFAVVNHDAQFFPGMKYTTSEGLKPLRFHRILADVPCTGDGTMRKNIDAWPKWNAAAGPALNPVQRRILKRGLDLLEVGGRLVYSTCSMNPVEDEAVLASVLLQDGYASHVEIKEINLPGLKFSPGVKSWKIMSRSGEFFESYDEVPDRLRTQIYRHLFPPEAADAEAIHLERCIRILPHLQNTGGFFVAVLEKVKEKNPHRIASNEDGEKEAMNENSTSPTSETAKDEKVENSTPFTMESDDKRKKTESDEKVENSSSATIKSDKQNETDDEKLEKSTPSTIKADDEQNETDKDEKLEKSTPSTTKADGDSDDKQKAKRKLPDPDNPLPLKKQKLKGYKEDPFVFLTGEELLWAPIKEFYNFGDDFPVQQLMARSNEGKKRNLYFVSNVIRDLVVTNKEHIRFINLGIKVLNRSPTKYCKCEYRLVQEGIEAIESFCRNKTASITGADLILLLKHENPFQSKFTKGVQNQISKLEQGSVILSYHPQKDDTGATNYPEISLNVCGWLGVVTMRTFLSKHEREHILRLFHQDISPAEKFVSLKNSNDAAQSDEDGKTDAATADSSEVLQDLSDGETKAEEKLQETEQEKTDENMEVSDATPASSTELKEDLSHGDTKSKEKPEEQEKMDE